MTTFSGRLILQHFSRCLAFVGLVLTSFLALGALMFARPAPTLVDLPVTLRSSESDGSQGLRIRFMPYAERIFVVDRLRDVDLRVFEMAQKTGDSFRVLVEAGELAGTEQSVHVHGLKSARNEYLVPRDLETELQKTAIVNAFLLIVSLVLGGWLFTDLRRRLRLDAASESSTISIDSYDPMIILISRFLPSKLSWVTAIRTAKDADEERRRIKIKSEVPKELLAVQALLKAPGGIDTENEQGQTAIHISALAGRTEALDMLLRHGAAINKQDKSGKTALILATEKGTHLGVVSKLLERGANPALTDRSGKSALDYAKEKQKEAFIQVLLRASRAMPPLLKSAASGKLGDALNHIKLGADVNTRGGEKGETALILAVKGDYLGLARMLLEYGADQRLADAAGLTPMMHAQAKKSAEMIALLNHPPEPIDRNAEPGDKEKEKAESA